MSIGRLFCRRQDVVREIDAEGHSHPYSISGIRRMAVPDLADLDIASADTP